MPYVPTLDPQLGRGIPVPGRTRGAMDCGPRTWRMAIDARTHGTATRTVAWLRARAGKPGPVPTTIDDAKRALDGLRFAGRRPLRYYRRRRVADVRAAIRKGYPVQLAIDYGAWNRLQGDETGDPNFGGGHSVLVAGQRDLGHGIEWLLCDPLEDGRRAEIQRGPRWVPRYQLIRAAVALAKGDRDGIWAGVIAGGHKA